jgi:hypothetical protein
MPFPKEPPLLCLPRLAYIPMQAGAASTRPPCAANAASTPTAQTLQSARSAHNSNS